MKALYDIKSNKVDTEQTMRCVDIIHKQVIHLIMLIIEMGKTNVS